MEIPAYLLREWHRHVRSLTERVATDPSDTRAADALRLVRRDLRRMERYLPDTAKTEKK